MKVRWMFIVVLLSMLMLVLAACSQTESPALPTAEGATPAVVAAIASEATPTSTGAAVVGFEANPKTEAPPSSEMVAAGGGGDPDTPVPTPDTPVRVPDTPVPQPQPSEGPFAQLAPDTGGAGTQVVVRGSGFPANTQVNVYLAGIVAASSAGAAPNSYASTITDRDGNYAVAFVMPNTWPSGDKIETGTLAVLIATEGFAVRATASFEYVATAQPPTPSPTATPQPTLAPTPTTAAPTAAPPTPTPTPARNPFAEVTPLTASGNAQVTLRGGGFPANTVVNVHLATFDAQVNGGAPFRYGATRTDGAGNFLLSFTLPALWPDGSAVTPGPLLILVATEDFRQQASAVLTYAAPIPPPANNPSAQVQPSSGTANTQVTISGGGFPANRRLDLYLAGVVGASASASAPTSYANATTDANGNYRMTLTMPATWPDGEAIQSGKLAMLIATQDFAVRANATFDYVRAVVSDPQAWQGRYYANRELQGEPMITRNDTELHFYWGMGGPDPGLPADNFSVSWQRTIQFKEGLYRFIVEMDDGARLYLDEQLVLESWRPGGRRTVSVDVGLPSGEVRVRLEYFEDRGDATINLRWVSIEDAAPAPTATPNASRPQGSVLFSDHPRNNRRRVNQFFCSGFESECEFAGCARNYRLVWGPYCREGDYPYIQAGLYRVTVYGTGAVRVGATDFGATNQLFALGEKEVELPASYTFCWPGRSNNGFGFETIVQSLGTYAAVDWITVEYLGERCN